MMDIIKRNCEIPPQRKLLGHNHTAKACTTVALEGTCGCTFTNMRVNECGVSIRFSISSAHSTTLSFARLSLELLKSTPRGVHYEF